MDNSPRIEFAIGGLADGVEISPKAVPYGLMMKFNEEVADLIAGSNERRGIGKMLVEIKSGSYALVASIPETLDESFEADVEAVAKTGSLDEVDPARAEILERWQERSREYPDLEFKLSSPSRRWAAIKISSKTNFVRKKPQQWAEVERYLLGEVFEAGGTSATNVHIRLADSTTKLKVDTSPDQLRDEEHPIYRLKMLHVVGEQNTDTGEYRKLRLVKFGKYLPKLDDAAFRRMTEVGEKAWADVNDPGAWVRTLRDK